MIIPNCGITKTDARVIEECVMSKDSDTYKKTKQYHTGIDLEADAVYSLYDGIIVMIGSDPRGYTVIIRTGSTFCISYSSMKELASIELGSDIHSGDEIGEVKNQVHVEYLTRGESKWPVRIGQDTWYKTNTDGLFTVLDNATSNITKQDMFSYVDVVEIPDGIMD